MFTTLLTRVLMVLLTRAPFVLPLINGTLYRSFLSYGLFVSLVTSAYFYC